MDNCYFLRLPRELRDRVYRNLISVKHNRTPNDNDEAIMHCAASKYKWNIDPTILRVNKQIHGEAKEIMGLDNDFVVVGCAAKELEMKSSHYPVLWPGKTSKIVIVPGERMRMLFADHGQTFTGPAHVMLVEELRDFCIQLSTMWRNGEYRMSDVDALVTVRQLLNSETPRAKTEREKRLLLPLTKLRFFKSAEIQGVEHMVAEPYIMQMTRQGFEAELVRCTIDELVSSGDCARDVGQHFIANKYYDQAHDYLDHFIERFGTQATFQQFDDPTDILAFEFKILQRRALNFLEGDNFHNALDAAEMALRIARELFLIGGPTTGPPTDARGRITKGAMRQFNCRRIKEGAERYGQRIKCEDIGRCYYYKSIAEHIVNGDEALEQAEEDKYMAIGCCLVSETATEEDNIPKELLELDMRTMKRMMEEDEWEDDEEWVDED